MILHWVQKKTLSNRRSGAVFRKGLRNQQNLAARIDAVVKLGRILTQSLEGHPEAAKAGAATITHIEKALKLAQADLNGLDRFFSVCLAPSFYAGLPTPTSVVSAMKVFNTTELVEEIFKHLDVMDLLRAQQVNKQMANVVQSSSMLRRLMFLTPSKSKHFRKLDLSGKAGAKFVKIETVPLDYEDTTNLEAFKVQFMYRLPRLGSRARMLQLCQPPIRSMEYRPTCCGYNSDDEDPEEDGLNVFGWRKVENQDGLTLGDLYDTAEKLMADHRLCVDARESLYDDDDGFVRPKIVFSGTVELEANDPLVLKKLARMAKIDAIEEACCERNAELEEYMDAKQNGKYARIVRSIHRYILTCAVAYNAGEAIPTLAEFTAAKIASTETA